MSCLNGEQTNMLPPQENSDHATFPALSANRSPMKRGAATRRCPARLSSEDQSSRLGPSPGFEALATLVNQGTVPFGTFFQKLPSRKAEATLGE